MTGGLAAVAEGEVPEDERRGEVFRAAMPEGEADGTMTAAAQGAAPGVAAEGATGPEDTFELMVEGYPGSFWEAVAEEIIDQPALLTWNEWQAWRSLDGGLPKGVRDREVQSREVDLYQKAMTKYYGQNYKLQIRKMKEDRKKLEERQKEVMRTARRLFSSQTVGSTGSSRSASDTSPLLTRANRLLPNLGTYEVFKKDMEELIELGLEVYPGTFTEEFVFKIRTRMEVLQKVYRATDLDRDSPSLGGAVAEAFMERFKGIRT